MPDNPRLSRRQGRAATAPLDGPATADASARADRATALGRDGRLDAGLRGARGLDGAGGGVVKQCPHGHGRLFLEPMTDKDASRSPYEWMCLACGYRVAAV